MARRKVVGVRGRIFGDLLVQVRPRLLTTLLTAKVFVPPLAGSICSSPEWVEVPRSSRRQPRTLTLESLVAPPPLLTGPVYFPPAFAALQVEMCDQALNPASQVERDLVEFASKVEDAISPGSSEEWFLEHALDAIHDDTPSPAKWHLLKQMTHVLSLQHNTPHSPASLRLLSANVTHWRPEVRDWAFSLEAHGVLLQELHLTTEAAHEAAIAASKRGLRLFTSPPFLSEKRRPLGGFGVLIRSFLNPRHVLTHTVEGCGFLAVSLRCSGFELTLISIYLQSGTGFNSPVNADVLARLLAFLPSLRGVWIVAGDWNNPIQDLLATRLEEDWVVPFKPHCALRATLQLSSLQLPYPQLATFCEVFPDPLPFQPAVPSPSPVAEVNLLGLTSTDKLSLDFAELSSFLEVSHGFPDRGRGAFVPILHKPLVQGHSVAFAWKGQLPSLVSAVLHLLDRPEVLQPFLWSSSDTSLPSEVRAFCDQVRDGSLSSANLRVEGTALLGQLRREQTAQQADQYGEWLEEASGSHLGPLFRAIKSHEQVLDRPFQDCDGLRRVFERHEHWGRLYAGTLAPLTVPNLQKLLKKAGKKKGGPDGWSYPALRALDPAALQLVADFLARAEAEVLLPFQLTCVQVALLPNSADKERPISLLPCLWRLWARARWKDVAAWTSAYSPDHPWDRAVPGQASLDTALARLVRSEHSKLEKTHIVSLFFVDLRGFFDSVSDERLLLQGLAHRFPPLHLWFALQVYQGPRCLVADSIAATPLFPGRGVPQGCPLAPSLSKLTMSEPLKKVSALPSVTNTDLWLDDVSLDVVGPDPVEVASAALQAYRVLHASLGLEGLEVETTKTKFVAGTVRARAALQQLRRPGEPETADLVKDLGLDCAAGRRRRITTAQKRFRTGIGRVRHMRRLRIRRRWVRGRLLQASALKAGLYGRQAVGVAPKRLKGRFEHGSADVILDLMSHKAVDPHQLVVVEQLQALGRLASSASSEGVRLLNRTWASSWSRQASATHGWKIVNGPVSALIQYLLDLRVSAPTPEVWTHREATFHFRFCEPGAVFEASAFLRQVIQLERWSRIGPPGFVSSSPGPGAPTPVPPPLGAVGPKMPVAQLLPCEGYWQTSFFEAPSAFSSAFTFTLDGPGFTLFSAAAPDSYTCVRRDRRSKHRRHRLQTPGLFTQLQVEMCDQALNPASQVEFDLVEFASKVEDAISPGSSEEWFLERALDAIHDDTPSPAKWHLLKQMAHVLSLQHTTPHSPASLRLLSANVTHWRPEVRDWAFSLEAHGVLLQELHLTTEAAHEAAIAASRRGLRLFTSPPFLSEKRRPLGGFGVLIRSFLNPRHVLTHTVEGCGFLAVSLRCSGFELTLVSIYLQSGTGFNSPVNADVLARLLAFLPSLRGVWIVAGDWNNPIQDLLATRLEEVTHGRFLGSGAPTAATDREIDYLFVSSPAVASLTLAQDWVVPFKPHCALRATLQLSSLQLPYPQLATFCEVFPDPLPFQPSVPSPSPVAEVNLLGLTSTDKLTLDFAELSSFLEVSHGFPDRGRGAFVPILHKPLVQGHSVTFAWKGQLPSLVSAVLHLLDRPEVLQPFLWSASDTSLPSEVRAFCDRVRDGSTSSANLRAEGTALLGQLRREQTAQQADQYGEWLEEASGSHLGPLFRAIKSHEQVLDRPFQGRPLMLAPWLH
ncbi:unnamed protein product [Symbiodinium sp. CCMP2592]|nr:unnamed protein product [Symbiodinium sp. CCMP2592]